MEKIKLIHPFLYRAHDIKALLKGCNKINTFCNRLERQSLEFPNRYNPDDYKGDGLEFLAEALIKLSPADNRIGIGNYEPILEGDTGVDGIGKGIDLRPAAVQVKYRQSNWQLTANADHLSNFVMTAQNKYGVPVESKKHLLIITTAKGLHHFTDNEMFGNKVRCIGYDELKELLDNNLLFWEELREIVKAKKS